MFRSSTRGDLYYIRSLKLIICYISLAVQPSQVNIAEVSTGFHQADWSITLIIVYCYLISFLFWFICLSVYLFLAQLDSTQMQTPALFKFALFSNSLRSNENNLIYLLYLRTREIKKSSIFSSSRVILALR